MSRASSLIKHDWKNVTIAGALRVRCARCREVFSINMTSSKVYCYKPGEKESKRWNYRTS